MMDQSKLLCLLALATLAACEPSGCEEVSRTLVTDPSAPVLMGETFADLQAAVGGTRSGPLRWYDNNQYVRGFPAAGESKITVTIAEPIAAWDIEVETHNKRNERLSCSGYLETALQITLRSDDGVLDASIIAPVSTQIAGEVSIWVDVTDEDLGMLPWNPVEDDAELYLVLEYGSLTGPEGSLRYSYEQSDDSGNGVGFMTELATWTLPNVDPERIEPPPK
jgi:hypothetical protein